LKTLIDFSLNRSFSAERLVGSGGMPSSHSSTVCALLVSSGICYGVSSFEFAVSFVLASVVMYDAIGVRQETGKQAKLLNMIMDQNILKMDNLEFQKRLKEFVGHTPLQVFAGAILGIGLALLTNLFYV
ncbi:MAG: divergent PAP2 family protein, partial [Hungatella sp.]